MKQFKIILIAGIVIALLSACSPTLPATTQVPIQDPTANLQQIISTATPEPVQKPPEDGPKQITVLAAASLTEPFKEIGKLFEGAHPDIKVVFNFAGSQQLAQQLVEGAEGDVFASASIKYMDDLVTNKLVNQTAVANFVNNQLVVIFPAANPAGITSLADLAKSGVKVDLAAKEVPVGKYSLDFLDKAAQDPSFPKQFKEDVLKNVVSYEDNVKSVLTKVELGEADAGIVYTSDLSGKDPAKIGHLDIPEGLNVIATYPIAALSDSKNPELAQAFVDLVLSQQGQDILAKYGFIKVK